MSSSARPPLPSSTTATTAAAAATTTSSLSVHPVHPVHPSSTHTSTHSSAHAVRPIYPGSSLPVPPSSSTSSVVHPQPSQVKDPSSLTGRPVPPRPTVSSSAPNRPVGNLPVNGTPSGSFNPSLPNATSSSSSSAVKASGGPAGVSGQGPRAVAPKEERSFEERSAAESLRRRVTVALSHDQYMTLHPDTSSFENVADVIQRLLPYHIWQIPDQDLLSPSSLLGADQKGKARATDWQWDDVAQSTSEEEKTVLKEAVRFAKRKRELEKRFVSLKRKEGQHASPSLQAIPLGRAAVADELRQIYHLKASLRSATSEQSAAVNRLNELRRELAALRAPPPPPPPPQQILNRSHLQTGSARPPANYVNRGAPLQQRAPVSTQNMNGVNAVRPVNSGMYRPPTAGTPGRPPAPRPGYQTFRPPIQSSSSSSSSQVRPSSTNHNASSRPYSSTPNARPSVPAQTSNSTSGASHIDLHAPVPLSLPASTLPTLMNLGIIPRANSAPDAPSLVWNLRVEGVNIAFNLILGTLSPAQLSGLAGILSKVQAGNGSGANTSAGSSAATSSSAASNNSTASATPSSASAAAAAAAAAIPRLPPLASSARLGQGSSSQGAKPDSKVKTGPGA